LGSLALADDLGLTRFHVASDCKQVVTDIGEVSLGKYGVVITEIKSRTARFLECSFVFERKAHNYGAHNLARHVLTHDAGHHLWLDILLYKHSNKPRCQ
jgi:hypothetical protein